MMILLAIVCWINVEKPTVQSDRIKKVVEGFVSEQLGAGRGDWVLEFRSLPLKLTVRSSDYSVRVGLDVVPKLKGYVGIPVEVLCSGKVEQRLIVPVHVRTFGNVIVTSRQLEKHEIITNREVTLQRIETTTLPDDILIDEYETDGKRTVRIIGANSVLCRSMMENIPTVRQDDPVTVAVRTMRASVSLEGVAKEDGCVGDVITVQRVGSHERLRGKIVDHRTVEIDLEDLAPSWKNKQHSRGEKR
jgi:flagella basal body P-ring formation protein FlgA